MNNTMKERAIDWIVEANPIIGQYSADIIADYLIFRGAIFPPCTVGDMVYHVKPYYNKIEGDVIKSVRYEDNEFWFETENEGEYAFDENALGKLYFLEMEDAEQALKEYKKSTETLFCDHPIFGRKTIEVKKEQA